MTVTVCSTEGETATLLASVLDNNHTAASLLARAIHRDPATSDAQADALMVPLNPSDLGIWIDPIGERPFNPPAATYSTAAMNNSRLLFLAKMPPASTSRVGRRCWRRAASSPQASTALWSWSGFICGAAASQWWASSTSRSTTRTQPAEGELGNGHSCSHVSPYSHFHVIYMKSCRAAFTGLYPKRLLAGGILRWSLITRAGF